MNVYRQLAADYSNLTLGLSDKIVFWREVAVNRKYSKYTRRQAIRNLRLFMKELVAYAEQVELHLEQALEKDLS